jgi:hypothetical protein
MVNARSGPRPDQRWDLPGDINRPGRLSTLVIDDIHGRPRALQPDHRAEEVRSVHPVQPGRPHDITGAREQLEHSSLAGQL